MTIGIDVSRANLECKTGVEFYSYFLIQELKKIIPIEHQVLLYSPDPLRGDLGELPSNWKWQNVRSPINLPIGRFIGNGKPDKSDKSAQPKTSIKSPIGDFIEGGRFHQKRPFLWTQLGLSLEMLWRPPDVLFVPSHALPFICPKNSFVTIHDIGFDRFPESYHLLARLYHRLVTRFAVWRAKKIITISEFSKKELVDVYRAKSEKIVAIPNGYDSSRFHANFDEEKKQQVLQKYSLIPPPSSPFERGRKVGDGYIFYVGRLEKKKNILTLVKAFEIVKSQLSIVNCQLLLSGSPGYGFAEIIDYVERSSIKNDVKFIGYATQSDLPYLMSGASVFVFPSLYEGFGIPVLEAMAVGTPVVASDIPALREIVSSEIGSLPQAQHEIRSRMNDAALFANPNSPEDFAAKIKQVLENDTMRQALIDHGLEKVKKYSWAETARLTLTVLTQ